jgi:nucleotide-binding universal stress UspA family protein
VSVNQAAEPIVVGVDGSQHSFWAIDWAVEEASRHDRSVLLVHAFDDDAFTLIPGDGRMQLELAAEAVLRDALAAAEGRGVRVTAVLEHGRPGPALVDAGEGAAMLVVGSRGRNRCADRSRGSVSSACARRSPCPVVVIDEPAGRSHDQLALAG